MVIFFYKRCSKAIDGYMNCSVTDKDKANLNQQLKIYILKGMILKASAMTATTLPPSMSADDVTTQTSTTGVSGLRVLEDFLGTLQGQVITITLLVVGLMLVVSTRVNKANKFSQFHNFLDLL